MDNIWGRFDAVSFEKLAIEYANAVFPEWKWKNTQQTRDGGKDGTAIIFNQQTRIGKIQKEAWVEAKYTKNYRYAIPLSRIASTVLIGHNNRDLVEILLIVTNASFSETTIHEIYMVFGNRVIFVSGRDLLLWMQKSNKSQISSDYQRYENEPFYMIGKPLTIRKEVLCQSVSTSSEKLILGERYDLFITLNVSIASKSKLQFEIIEYSNLITVHNGAVIEANIGTNFISIPFTASRTGSITQAKCFLLLKEISSSSLVDIRLNREIISNPRIEILCKSQNICGQKLLQNYALFQSRDKGIYFNLIEGAAGHGKSHILMDFIKNRQCNEYCFIKFSQDNELTNSVLLLRLLTFIVWGRFFSENILYDDSNELDDEILRLQQISGYNKYYTDYLRYLADNDNAFAIVNKLCSKKDLIPPTYGNIEKIIILDDLQFLGEYTSRFLLQILNQETLYDYKIFFIFAKRTGDLHCRQLDNFIKTSSSQSPFVVQLLEDDIHNSLKYNGLDHIPISIFPKLNKNIFILKDFIAVACMLKDKHPIDLLKDNQIKRLLAEQQMPFVYENFSEENKRIIDIVYFFKSGVDASYLYSRYGDATIDYLVYKDIIKNSSTGYVPYHDLLWESIFSVIKYDSEHIYDYATYKLQNGYVIEYFSVLGFFPSKFDRKKGDFISLITDLHYKQKYANVYYILDRFFSIKHHERLLYDRYDHAILLFYYAYALFNVGDKNGLDIFEQAYARINNSNQSERERTLSCLILSEIANCHYWELKFDSIVQKYGIIAETFSQKTQKTKEDWIAYFTIATRYIRSLFFMDKNEEAITTYNKIQEQIQDSEIEKLAIHLLLSYNEANFVDDAFGSFRNIEHFMNNHIKDMPIKNKFVIKSTYFFMGILLGLNKIEDLKECIEWGKSQSLEYNYRLTKLDLAVCHAIKGEYNEVEQIIHSIIDMRDFPVLACGKYYNLEAIIHLHKGEYGSALISLDAQERCFSNLGASFKDKIRNNKQLVKSSPSQFKVDYKLGSLPTFLVDIRL